MREQAQNRPDLTDVQCNRIELIVKQHLNKRGGLNFDDNRVFVNAYLRSFLRREIERPNGNTISLLSIFPMLLRMLF